ncbi:hypothetical protein ACFOEE_15665 [Pseudoalteromonas fenneropenaei]|uniref:Uncharacterized protein n=1 Tax=Pseudoalteromonas fenneropenaei TaxID=1737459 RepID=A0ABV7CNC3_9GAMM
MSFNIRSVTVEIAATIFVAITFSILYFLIGLVEFILSHPQLESFIINIFGNLIDGSEVSYLKYALYVLFLFCFNFVVKYLIANPRRFFSEYFVCVLSSNPKCGVLARVKRSFGRFLRAFLTDDEINQNSLILGVNLTLFVCFFDFSNFLTNVSYSIVAAIVLQYFIYVIPREHQKEVFAMSVLSASRTLRARDEILFFLLGYESTLLLSEMTIEEKKEFENKISKALTSTRKVGFRNGEYIWLEPAEGGFEILRINPETSVSDLIHRLLSEDEKSYRLLNKERMIDYFPKLTNAVARAWSNLVATKELSCDTLELKAQLYLNYYETKQALIICYHRTLRYYAPDHDAGYLLPKL